MKKFQSKTNRVSVEEDSERFQYIAPQESNSVYGYTTALIERFMNGDHKFFPAGHYVNQSHFRIKNCDLTSLTSLAVFDKKKMKYHLFFVLPGENSREDRVFYAAVDTAVDGSFLKKKRRRFIAPLSISGRAFQPIERSEIPIDLVDFLNSTVIPLPSGINDFTRKTVANQLTKVSLIQKLFGRQKSFKVMASKSGGLYYNVTDRQDLAEVVATAYRIDTEKTEKARVEREAAAEPRLQSPMLERVIAERQRQPIAA